MTNLTCPMCAENGVSSTVVAGIATARIACWKANAPGTTTAHWTCSQGHAFSIEHGEGEPVVHRHNE